MSLRVDAGLRALAHPVRLRMLSLLTGAAMTAAEVARELAMSHANASYHLRQLLAAGAVEIAGEERIRGGVAKRYRYVVKEDRPAGDCQPTAPGPDRLLMYEAMATELRRRAALIRYARGNHMTDAELWVDPEVWQRVRDEIGAASTELHRAARPPREPGTIRVSASIALFELVQPETAA